MTRLFHVSDLHFGREDREAVDWFADRVHSEKPDAVIVTGDLTMRAKKAEFAAASAYLSALNVPVTVEPGNHDLPLYNPFKRLFRPYKHFRRLEAKIERPLDLASIWLVPLKTTARFQLRNWSKGWVSERGLAKAIACLRRKPAGAVGVVACHHPLVDREDLESQARTRGGSEALDALVEAGAEAVLSGHVHDPFDVEWRATIGSIRMVGAGTLSERVRASPPSFNELCVEDGQLTVRVRAMA
ncbi:metallophosphoesterase family protein [Sphingomonas crocodyli]|uniref:Metallophosphoesterase n=1 Tax=Sphingomonas crocodyli TaxID=1979270 RepID=A0A437M7W0_9SPHN|nr:metallophosphoesterase [Sphingomonas crocodyli]RVT93808.1 metallophosphoesterase [Sphingomonas crocodyli]